MVERGKSGCVIIGYKGKSFRVPKFFIELIVIGICLLVVALGVTISFYFNERSNNLVLRGDNLILLNTINEKDKEFEIINKEIEDLRGEFNNIVSEFSGIKNSE